MTENVHRHPDGAIDFDFYRAEAAALRRQALREGLGLQSAAVGAAVMVAAVGFATVVPHASLDDRIAAIFSHPTLTR